jgi:hypothetical protein
MQVVEDHNSPDYPLEQLTAPPQPKQPGSGMLILLSICAAIACVAGSWIVSQQIQRAKSRDFLEQVLQRHLTDSPPVQRAVGTLTAVKLDETSPEQLPQTGGMVFQLTGSQATAKVIGIPQPNGLELQLEVAGHESRIPLEPLLNQAR